MFEIISLEVTPFVQNTRILWGKASRRAIVIDPGGEADRINSELRAHQLACDQIWLTHSHLDHCGGVRRLKELTGAKLVGHPVEREMRSHVQEICLMYGLTDSDLENCPEPEILVQGGETLTFDGANFQVIFCPGHSPGHVAFYQPDSGILLSGDVLFKGSIGRTDLPGGSYHTLMQSIHHLLETLPPSTRVLPGHGPETTLAEEVASNPFILEEVA